MFRAGRMAPLGPPMVPLKHKLVMPTWFLFNFMFPAFQCRRWWKVHELWPHSYVSILGPCIPCQALPYGILSPHTGCFWPIAVVNLKEIWREIKRHLCALSIFDTVNTVQKNFDKFYSCWHTVHRNEYRLPGIDFQKHILVALGVSD